MARIAQPQSCAYCGKTNLQWGRVINRYGRESSRLIDSETRLPHVCLQYSPKKRYRFNAPAEENKPFNNPFVPKPQPQQQPEQEQDVNPEVLPDPQPEPIPEPIPEKVIAKVWGGKHKFMNDLLDEIRCKQNVLLVGPAGSGKTHAAMQVAGELFGWTTNEYGQQVANKFYPLSVGPQTSKSDQIGYMDAHGMLVRSVLREAYEHGGVFLLDEVDAGNAGVLTVLNSILANDMCSFPDGVIFKHPDFRCIAAANTFGQGANVEYAGRQKLDGATLDRFVGIEWEYDELFEESLAENNPKFTDWVLFVWKLRENAAKLGIKRIFGTRRIQQGIKMLRDGRKLETVKARTVFFGIGIDERLKLERGF